MNCYVAQNKTIQAKPVRQNLVILGNFEIVLDGIINSITMMESKNLESTFLYQYTPDKTDTNTYMWNKTDETGKTSPVSFDPVHIFLSLF